MSGRLVLDITSLAQWAGSPVGIVRVQHELAQYARRSSRPLTLCVYDKGQGQFRQLRPEWQAIVAGFDGAVLLTESVLRGGWRRWIPGRQRLVLALEQHRLTTRRQWAARFCDVAQRALLTVKAHQFPLYNQQGRRLPMLTPTLALSEAIEFNSTDTLLMAGTDWYHQDAARLGVLKRQHGFRLAAMCYDILPITHPAWFPAEDAAIFRRYWEKILPLADSVIVNSQAVARDVRDFCRAQTIPLPSLRLVKLGCAPPVAALPQTLPARLRAGHYALFVSTVEPRKGHAMLLAVWRRLAATGVLAARDFRLVLVGRQGWQVEQAMQEIVALSDTGQVLHLAKADDAMRETLMAAAAFCVYPSLSEGFGLPVVEAFARGKAVLCSSGGSLPEVAGDLAPCLDPQDAAVWEEWLRRWIEQPETVCAWEEKIRQGFRLRAWEQAASDIIQAALGAGDHEFSVASSNETLRPDGEGAQVRA